MKYTVTFNYPYSVEYPHIEANNPDEAIDIAFEFLADYIPNVTVKNEEVNNND